MFTVKFKSAIETKEIQLTKSAFPAGETYIKIQTDDLEFTNESINIYWNYENDSEIFELCLIVSALRELGATTIRLFVPYLPHARQDRICRPGESFSLKCLSDIINSLKLASVIVTDVHSSVAIKQINNCVNLNVDVDEHLPENIKEQIACVLAPDEGAFDRARNAAERLKVGVYHCKKERMGSNVKVTLPNHDFSNENILIIDDICDGGRTFIELAKKLNVPKEQMNLYVTHGLFTKGLTELQKYYNYIGAYNAKSTS